MCALAILTASGCGGAGLRSGGDDAGGGLDAGQDPDGGVAGLTDSGATSDAGLDPDTGAGFRGGPPAWVAATPFPGGDGRWGARMVYVPSEERFILFGGHRYPNGTSLGDTWSFDARSRVWSRIDATGTAPTPRYCYCMTYIPATHEVLLVGGRDDRGPLPPSAFTLDLRTASWTAVSGPVPPGVIGCSAEWMPNVEGGRAIVFGGGSGRGVRSDTWSYDPRTRAFTELSPALRPPSRADPAHMYDPMTGRMLVFSGAVLVVPPYEFRDDLWAFDGTDWTEITSAGPSPSERRFVSSAYDPVGRRWYIFSGTDDREDREDLWAFDLATDTWSEIGADDGPSPRAFAASSYDPVSDGMLMFGGFSQLFEAKSDGWILKF